LGTLGTVFNQRGEKYHEKRVSTPVPVWSFEEDGAPRHDLAGGEFSDLSLTAGEITSFSVGGRGCLGRELQKVPAGLGLWG
jgi:hypothetical protein